jgi:3-oxoacyl-[acyl-carrier protein] reductase
VNNEKGCGETLQFDVTDYDSCQNKLNEVIDRFKNIEILVNNAGIIADGLFAMMPRKDWESVIQTSLDGFFNVTKPVLKRMLRNRKGSIVSISSVSGLMGNRGQVNYSAAKAGLIGAHKALAAEVARIGIRVNVVTPGIIDTEMIKEAPVEYIKQMIPMGRIGKPEEVAKVVRFLCSKDASYITGQIISVNGGMF